MCFLIVGSRLVTIIQFNTSNGHEEYPIGIRRSQGDHFTERPQRFRHSVVLPSDMWKDYFILPRPYSMDGFTVGLMLCLFCDGVQALGLSDDF